MTVRLMRSDERDDVVDMMRRVWDDADDGDLDEVTVFVWPREGGLGGFVAVAVRSWAEGCRSAPVPYVEGWFVAENLRRTGVGRALIEAAERWARSHGFTELGSDVRLDNTASREAHLRLGFSPTERLQHFRKSLDGVPLVEIRVEPYRGARAELRQLFELAEDSPAQLDSYLHDGRVLVAVSGPEVIGHLQLVGNDRPGQLEIKNMAVRAADRGRGVGGRLIDAAIELATAESATMLLVATAAADTGNLRFYQRHGFRLRSVDRDAFTPATGYPVDIEVDGIPLRDRVWLDYRCSLGGSIGITT